MKRMKQTTKPRRDDMVLTISVPASRRMGHQHQRPVRFKSGKAYDRRTAKQVSE